LLSKSQENYLRETYARQKKVPKDLVEELKIDPELLKTEQEEPHEEPKVEELDGKAQLRRHFAERPDIKAKCNILHLSIGVILADNFEWIVKVTSIMAVGRLEKTAKIETRRFVEVINMLRTGLTFAEIIEIANILCAFDESTNKIIYFYDFMKPIKLILAPSEPEASDGAVGTESKRDVGTYYTEQDKEQDKDGKEEDKEDVLMREKRAKEEKKKESEEKESAEDERVELEKEVQGEPEISMSEINEAWCNGEFTIVINRCHDCHQHRDYTWHYEEVKMICNNNRSI